MSRGKFWGEEKRGICGTGTVFCRPKKPKEGWRRKVAATRRSVIFMSARCSCFYSPSRPRRYSYREF
jgi:hypothetical protein